MRKKLFGLLALVTVALLTLGGCSSNRDSDSISAAADTVEDVLRATAYVGADRCSGCHETLHEGWADSAHTKKLRDGSLEANYSNDGDFSGRSDFFDDGCSEGNGLNLGEAAFSTAFAKFGADAPILCSEGGQAYVKIGDDSYAITYTLGGGGHDDVPLGGDGDGFVLNDEATWKQRYITTDGKSNYILPVQFNQQTQEYVTYHAEDWYDDENSPLAERIKNQSYERRCAGCHVTGLQVALDGDEWTMKFSDISVACEACHGPGGQHSTTPSKENIINPATMIAATDLNDDGEVDQIDNLIIRNYVCYACHTRGSGYASAAAGTSLGYPSKGGSDDNITMYIPGLDWREYYNVTESTGSYWGGTPSTGFIASKQHHQQQQDLDKGPHAPDKSYDHECFVCHDMHKPDTSMVVSTIESDGLEIEVEDPDDNDLCLSCHATHGDFEEIDAFDVKTGADVVEEAVIAHMAKQSGKSRTKDLDCTGCHMPKMSKSAIWVEKDTGEVDDAGEPIMEVIGGDVSAHTFEIVWPNLSVVNSGMPNSCNRCHNGGGEDDPLSDESEKDNGTLIIRDWSNSGHGDSTSGAFNSGFAQSSSSCNYCHTAKGARNHFNELIDDTFEAEGFAADPGDAHYCYACHSDVANDDGFGMKPYAPGAIVADYAAAGTAKTAAVFDDLGTSNICVSCHSGKRSGQDIKDGTNVLEARVTSHYAAVAGVIYNKISYQFTGQVYDSTGHGSIGNGAGPCVGCHMEESTHTFLPFDEESDTGLVSICAECHGDSMTADGLASREVNYASALAVLGQIMADQGITIGGDGVKVDGVITTDLDLAGSAFNYKLLKDHTSGYVHNRYQAKQLLFDSMFYLLNIGSVPAAPWLEMADVTFGEVAVDTSSYVEGDDLFGLTSEEIVANAAGYLDGNGLTAGIQRR
ncbi:MAG: hypothetical protein C0618_03855 [Desulfuromonas sp.]|nr:MAG: hypothetical protein C0618_03855 [Desulfuromonas sp.]